MSGSNIVNQLGTYGTQGTPAPGNVPGARESPLTWTDTSGNLWLFGGYGYDSQGNVGYLNDLWEYSGGEWTWMNGSDVLGQAGVYGTEGMSASGDVPGARAEAVSWTDTSGNFWLFGGNGFDSEGNPEFLNDLWKYSAGEWTWMSGSNIGSQLGTYGTQGTAAPGNVPGGRASAVSWIDTSGNLWLFGGEGLAQEAGGFLNDLWKYSAGEWTWMSGSNAPDQPGLYGLPGMTAPGNFPGAREEAVSWIDASGSLWLFGGNGYDTLYFETGVLNDLWKYSGGEWTWMSGFDLVNQVGIYGTKGTADAANVPGARALAVSWTDASGNLWLFGGVGNGSFASTGLNDLWKYSRGEWTWMSGSNSVNQLGTYGTQGTAAPGNVPGARASAVSWIDTSGNLWLFGGGGFDSQGNEGLLNDLWRYEP